MEVTQLVFQTVLLGMLSLIKHFSDKSLHTPQTRMDELEGRPFSGKQSFVFLRNLFHQTIYPGPSRHTQNYDHKPSVTGHLSSRQFFSSQHAPS